jgi:hypothetical protein
VRSTVGRLSALTSLSVRRTDEHGAGVAYDGASHSEELRSVSRLRPRGEGSLWRWLSL